MCRPGGKCQAKRFRVILKPNIGGSGAHIVRFDTPEELRSAVAAGSIDLGIDQTGLVQEYLPAEGGFTDEASIDVGGVEYLVNQRDGQIYYYDINALSNFVADAPQVVGFDPFVRLVDFLLKASRTA